MLLSKQSARLSLLRDRVAQREAHAIQQKSSKEAHSIHHKGGQEESYAVHEKCGKDFDPQGGQGNTDADAARGRGAIAVKRQRGGPFEPAEVR